MAAKKKAPPRKGTSRPKDLQKATKSSREIKKSKRRSPLSRADGELRLIQAALYLTRQQPFSVVGVRDIAERADVNHGFVHTWFGGKTELFLAVRTYLARSIADRINSAEANILSSDALFDEDVVHLVKLNAWLVLEGETELRAIENQPVLSAMSNSLQRVHGISGQDSQMAAQLSSALVFGTVIFGPAMGIEDDPEKLAAFWRHMLGLLAKNPWS